MKDRDEALREWLDKGCTHGMETPRKCAACIGSFLQTYGVDKLYKEFKEEDKNVEKKEKVTDKAMDWQLTLYNCSCHTFSDVEYALHKLLHCPLEKAKEMAVGVNEKGSLLVYKGHKERCEAMAVDLEMFGLRVAVTK